MDLVGPAPIEEHFSDAHHAVFDLEAQGNWVDLGSGAGFPGIALATYNPSAHVLLVESRQKRALFLRRVIAQSKLSNISIFHGRSETLTQKFDGIISRAYKKPLAYLEDAQRLSAPNAQTILLLGGQTPFVPPTNWTIKADKSYPIGTGSRRRLILSYERE